MSCNAQPGRFQDCLRALPSERSFKVNFDEIALPELSRALIIATWDPPLTRRDQGCLWHGFVLVTPLDKIH